MTTNETVKKIRVGFGEEEYGTVEAKEGKLIVKGPVKHAVEDQVAYFQEMLRREFDGSEPAAQAVIDRMLERLQGRMWAVDAEWDPDDPLGLELADIEPTENANPEGCNQYKPCSGTGGWESRKAELSGMTKRQLATVVSKNQGKDRLDSKLMSMPRTKLMAAAELQERNKYATRAMTGEEYQLAANLLGDRLGEFVDLGSVCEEHTWEGVVVNFDPNQPRVPAGQPGGGRWGGGSGATSLPSPTPGGKAKLPPSQKGQVGPLKDKVTPPPPSQPGKPVLKADVHADHDGDGVTDAARVGVPAKSVPPPPPIGRVPNLTPFERQVEDNFVGAYEANPDGMAKDFRNLVKTTTKPGEPPTYGTDDAKQLVHEWNDDDPAKRSQNRATLNVALHQTANAIAKRAFLQELDTLKPGDEVLVTVGGCGAGKGYTMKTDKEGKPFVPEAFNLKKNAKVVWDSAGDQNATENPWVLQEAKARGLKVNYLFVDADPKTNWADKERGVVKRAGSPDDGRMVDAAVFADSYAVGARNHQAFYEDHKGDPDVGFVFVSNRGKPKLIDGIPADSLSHDPAELRRFAEDAILTGEAPAPPHVVRGALIGRRIWGHG